MTFLTVHLEAPKFALFNHLDATVYISRKGNKTSYWCETGLFYPHEADQAQAHAERVSRKGVKSTIISRTLT